MGGLQNGFQVKAQQEPTKPPTDPKTAATDTAEAPRQPQEVGNENRVSGSSVQTTEKPHHSRRALAAVFD